MIKTKVANGIYWIEVGEIGFSIMCGCPADSVKHLMKRGLIVNREKRGVVYETGPQAILLSDTSVQNGEIANLAEFPVLQMLYRQGMLLPGHPNNTGARPMIVGLEDQVRAQSEYIFRGNYGLATIEEIAEAGLTRAQAREIMRMKLRFAFGKIRKSEELLDLRVIDRDAIELKDGLFLHRMGMNVYQFIYRGESVTVDLNLGPGQSYETSYMLDFHRIKREYFSITHTGEGDGWDVNRPCVSSLISFQGKLYLIDAGPNISHSLTALGLTANDIEGLFLTHAHDDHLAGLSTFVGSDHRLTVFATPLVRLSVLKKLSALIGEDEKNLLRFFAPKDLPFDVWTSIDGLEVMPALSPHPVETNVLFFRTFWKGGYRSYAHLSDTASFSVLKKMTGKDTKKNEITPAFFEKVKKTYLTPADLKKVDIGGGLIHGDAEDFREDSSGKILLCHTDRELTDREKEIGSNASFGARDVLIEARQNYLMRMAHDYLLSYFKEVPKHDLDMLLNCPRVFLNVGSILFRKNEEIGDMYLVINGVLELIDSEQHMHHILSAGTIAGEIPGFAGTRADVTVRAASHIEALQISRDIYLHFIEKNNLLGETRRIHANRRFLRSTWLFGEMISCPVENDIAREMEELSVPAGRSVPRQDTPHLYLVGTGEVLLKKGDRIVDTVERGGFFGEEAVLFGGFSLKTVAESKTTLYVIPAGLIKEIPIVWWKLMEVFDRREKSEEFRFEWKEEYSVRVKKLDDQHRALFEMVKEIAEKVERGAVREAVVSMVETFIAKAHEHFAEEERYVREEGKGFEDHRRSHLASVKILDTFVSTLKKGKKRLGAEQVGFLKNWLIDHVLGEDRSALAS